MAEQRLRPKEAKTELTLQNDLIVGKFPRELWASENRRVRNLISTRFLGKFLVDEILGKVFTFM
jgi:hypothetical protein